MKEDIIDILLCVGVPAGTKGFSYIQDALELLDADPDHFSGRICTLYERVAARYEATAAQVERAIRYAFEAALTRGRPELVAYYHDPVNTRNSHLLHTLYLRWKQGECPDGPAAPSGVEPADRAPRGAGPVRAAPTLPAPAEAEGLACGEETVRIYPDQEETVRIYPDPDETVRIYPDAAQAERPSPHPAEAARIYRDILAELRMMAAYLQTPPSRPDVFAAAGGARTGAPGGYAAEDGEQTRAARADAPASPLAAYPSGAHLLTSRPVC